MPSAKQYLKFVANTVSEAVARNMLADSGIIFRVGSRPTRFSEDGQLVDVDSGLAVNANMSEVQGVEYDRKEIEVMGPTGGSVPKAESKMPESKMPES